MRLIDPACGSGHFLLGAFHRLLHDWQKREPAVNVRELAQRVARRSVRASISIRSPWRSRGSGC